MECFFESISYLIGHGTIGFLVAAEIEIIPCQPIVQVAYLPCHSQDEYIQLFAKASLDKGKNSDFVEGLVYSHDEAVIMIGKMVPYSELKFTSFNPIGLWYKPWFYQHAKTYLSKPGFKGQGNLESYTEYIPLRDYYHRHTKAIFWVYMY